MPVYEYECQKCGRRSTFMEPMFEQPSLFRRKKRCPHCGSKKLVRVYSSFGISVSRSTAEMLHELKQHAKIQFVPPPPKPPWGDGPPPGGCPYEKMMEEQKQAEDERERSGPVEVRSRSLQRRGGIRSWLKRSRFSRS